MFEYPFGNLQQLNLDWILTEWRNYQQQIEDAIAPQWSETVSYPEDAVVFYNHGLYKCNVEASTVRIFKSEEWDSVTVLDLITGVNNIV